MADCANLCTQVVGWPSLVYANLTPERLMTLKTDYYRLKNSTIQVLTVQVVLSGSIPNYKPPKTGLQNICFKSRGVLNVRQNTL